jgi:hypothetical protein
VREAPVQSSTALFVAGVAEVPVFLSMSRLPCSGLWPPATPCRRSRDICEQANSVRKIARHKAVQHTAAPDRGPFVNPALKCLLCSKFRLLRSWHTGARGRVSGIAVSRTTRTYEAALATLAAEVR